MSIHIVQSGDSLWAISKRYNVPIQSIINVNGLPASGIIIPDLALYIPDQALPIRSKIVASGDTLWELAQKYRTNINAILSANPGIQSNNLKIGQKINIPSPLKLPMQTLGFIIPFSPQSFLPVLNQIANMISYLAIVSYSLTNEGYAYLAVDDSQVIEESKRLNVIPLLMIRNFENQQFSPELIGRVLENPVYRKNLINSLMNFIRSKGYGGVSIDFEFIPPPRRQDFNTFLNELKTALGPLILHVNVHAKTADLPQNRIVGAYDYSAIGKAADIVAVMTIDYGYPTGPPNPVSPIWWIEDVIQYSISLIEPKKLQMALPLYGYDWRVRDNLTKAYSLLYAQNLAISTGAQINYDRISSTPNFIYWEGSDRHIVWFDDIRSFAEKYKLADQYDLLGITFWQLSLPFPQNWPYMMRNFTIQ
ncbi:glycosyl hydrolase family 18 protein [Bacillus sp. DTU_2020_1000418_1_SI_GHA_SEK_038]|uniref:glycosyl hydrolase family 18 protein n=1 Tax=Bacillus sp. DTU_2020_1000418_1_SI_GHA_SEK_038 TaxID=3077585 RepID=UPI0028EA6983|nr:glycosyl hydrolase family 18 protein [Bacillus sp. DTU_2020_1000418_1_SI_GHA_SEK_038]WNS73491.1 glycosyl hydrolase family 18 protein [Bacillus sp. DTU_2020_1000418_1_SI_GHA_SEK_038]